MNKQRAVKEDGRYILFYSFTGESASKEWGGSGASGGSGESGESGESGRTQLAACDRSAADPAPGASELRWHPFLETWVIVASHRQERPVLPPPQYCPLCPTKPGAFPTEVPASDYEIVVFENKFPSLHLSPPPPTIGGTPVVPVAPAAGVCEVVLYSPDHHGTLAGTGVAHISNLIEVWADRFDELGRRAEVQYVFIFENRGDAVGVTLHHPHGQIYAYPFVPPATKQRLWAARRHFERHDRCLLCDVIEEETAADLRIVFENDTVIAYVPSFARFPYEVHIAPKTHRQAIIDLTDGERRDLAEAMTAVLSKYDGLWGFPMPYVMAQHQRPTDGGRYDYCHFQIEFYPVHRTETKLKHLAGSEVGVGTFIIDDTAEAFAARLQAVEVAGVSANGAPANGAPASGAPTNGAPTNGSPTNGAPTNGAPANGAPTNGAPTDVDPARREGRRR